MNVWWQFRCEENHVWEVYGPDGAEPPPGAESCPHDGSRAVTASPMPPADRVRLCAVPAARVSDRVRGTVVAEDEYFVEIARWDAGQHLRSERSFTWAEAMTRLERFRGATWDEAVNRWRRTATGRRKAEGT